MWQTTVQNGSFPYRVHTINFQVKGQTLCSGGSANGCDVYIDIDGYRYQGLAQLFPYRASLNPGFQGVSSNVTTPNPSMSLAVSDVKSQSGAPVAATNFSNRFAEAGPAKICDRTQCKLRPYAAYIDKDGYSQQFVYEYPLQPGQVYQYKVFHVGGGYWRMQFCDACICRSITSDVNLGIDNLPYISAAGENTAAGAIGEVPIGSITTSNNQYLLKNSSTWTAWCYTNVIDNMGGSISPCSNNSWTISYP